MAHRKNLFSKLDARIVAQLEHPIYSNDIAKVMRDKAWAQVKGCTSCNLHDTHQPVPFSYPKKRALFAVVGEAPGPKEDERGEPFVGPAGRMLRTYMEEAGVNAEKVTYINTVSCFPDVDGKVRAPHREETKACRRNLVAQLEAANVQHVMLIGGRALDAWRSDIKITDSHGVWGLLLDRWVCMGVFHPAAILRGQRQYKQPLQDDIAEFWNAVVHEVGFDKLISQECVRCGRVAVEWDRDAVAYCAEHWMRWKDQWERDRKRWGEPVVQLTLASGMGVQAKARVDEYGRLV